MNYILHPGEFIRRIAILLFAASALPIAAQGTLQEDENPNIYTGVSSAILAKDGTEINLLNSVNSFWIALNDYDGSIDATRITNRFRYSRADHILRISHGFSQSRRWDLGANIYYSRVRYDDEARSSPFRVYGDGYYEGDSTYSGISYIGIQTRVMPFASIPELIVSAGYGIPIGTDDQKYQLNSQRSALYLGALYSQRMGPSLLGQLQGNFSAYFRNSQNNRSLIVPSASGFLIFEMPGDQWYILTGLTYNITAQQYSKGYKFKKANQQLYGSLGVLYQPNRTFSVTLSGQIPFIFDSGSSHSIWVRESYFGLNLGFRFIF